MREPSQKYQGQRPSMFVIQLYTQTNTNIHTHIYIYLLLFQPNLVIATSLVDLDRRKDCDVEPQRTNHPNKASGEEQAERGQSHVAKVQNVRDKGVRVQLFEVHERVEEHVERR